MSEHAPASRASDIFFSDKDVLKNLGQRAARGGVISVASQGLRYLLQVGSTIVLARLLSPDAFGLVGMVTVLLQLCYFFRDFGLTQATIQRPEITRQQISNLFWFNTAISVGVTMLFAGSAPLIAWFYGRPELTSIVLVIAAGILIEGLGLQHRALMMRAMQFSRLAAAEVYSQVIATGLAVYLGWAGYGYWSLVALNVSGAAFRTVFYMVATRWVPDAPQRYVGTKPFITYGSDLFGFNVLNYFARNADNILIGKFVGAEALGYYSNAYRLLMLPLSQINGPISQSVVPMLSRLQNDPERYRAAYYQSLSVVLFIAFAIVGLLAAVTEPLILALLGTEWQPAVPLFNALLPAAYISAMNVSTGWVFVSLGTTKRQLKWTLFAAPFTVACMAAGLPFGAMGVSIGVSVSLVLIRIPYMLYAYQGTPLSFGKVARAIAYPLLLSIAVALVAKVTLLTLGSGWGDLVQLAVGSVLYGVLYVVVDVAIYRKAATSIRGVHFLLKRNKA